MGDMLCKVCGEPWDAYGIRHEFTTAERLQFLNGKGCPCCKGKSDEPVPDFETVLRSHVDNQDTDPLETLERLSEYPPDTVMCDCGYHPKDDSRVCDL